MVADFDFDLPGQEAFQRLLRKAPADLNEALWVGTRRSLAAFRRDWLRKVPVKMRGRGGLQPGAGKKRARTLGGGFQWEVHPSTKEAARSPTARPSGSLYTTSLAAKGLEIGGRVRARSGQKLAIPITGASSGGINDNTGRRGKPKASWKYLSKVMRTKRRQYRLFFIKRGDKTIVMAQRRPRRVKGGHVGPLLAEPPFPIFMLTTQVSFRPGRLRFFRTWREFAPGIERRYLEEIDRALARVARGRR